MVIFQKSNFRINVFWEFHSALHTVTAPLQFFQTLIYKVIELFFLALYLLPTSGSGLPVGPVKTGCLKHLVFHIQSLDFPYLKDMLN